MRKSSIIFYLICAVCMYMLGMIYSLHTGYFGSDYMIYHGSVVKFWSGMDPYIRQFYYLNYFHILVFWMYTLPYTSGFFVFLLITILMYLITLRNLMSEFEDWWFIGNAFVITLAFISFNTDIWLIFSLVMYQKYSERWFAPFFFILSLFKATMIFPALFLFIINSYYKKKINWNQFPAILFVITIISISALTSTGLYSNIITTEHSNLLFQVTHWMWWSYPIAIVLKYKRLKFSNLRIFWALYFIFQLTYGIGMVIFNDYIPTLIQSI